MPRESLPVKTARLEKIIAGLRKAYPTAHCELNYSNPLELLIATILSAQCTDKQVNLVTPDLFKRYPSARHYADADRGDLEKIISRLGFFRSKAKNIQACCHALVEQNGGKVPQSMEELTQLAGVGRKTANVVLGNAFDINEGVVVDTHVTRVSGRLGLTAETDPVKIERDLMPLFPREDWTMVSHLFIEHGRAICIARTPKCAECPLNDICPSSRVEPGTIARAAPAVTPVKTKRARGERASVARSSPSASKRSPKSPARGATGSRTSSLRPRRPGSPSR